MKIVLVYLGDGEYSDVLVFSYLVMSSILVLYEVY